MKAIILVAGYATRLYPLTIDRPKALLPIGGKPILDHIIGNLAGVKAIDEVFLISNDRFYQNFVDWNEEGKYPFPIRVLNDGTNSDDNKLGAIGDMKFIIDGQKIEDDIMVLAGDNYFTFELADFYKYYESVGKDCVCAHVLDDEKELCRMAVAQIDENNKVLHLEEKPKEPKSNVAVYATYIYKKETLPMLDDYLKEGNSPDAPGNFPAWLYKKKPVHLYIFDGECYDIGTPDSYKMVDELLSK